MQAIRDRTGSPLYFVSYVQDLSDRRATLSLLHGSERRLQAVIDHIPAIIAVIGRDHRFRLVNRQFEKTFGVTRDWIVGRHDTDVLPPSTIVASRAKDSAVLDGGLAAPEEQTVTVDGQERILLITRFALRGDNGEIDAVCTASTDITERRLEERGKRDRLHRS